MALHEGSRFRTVVVAQVSVCASVSVYVRKRGLVICVSVWLHLCVQWFVIVVVFVRVPAPFVLFC